MINIKRTVCLTLLGLLMTLSYGQEKTKLVDPFIGTGGHGHTYPGATSPFGMVQLSPDTRLTGWDGCSGYHYSDTIIYGFSHTHLSGTGVSDYGDILIMPVNHASTISSSPLHYDQFKSSFSHEQEFAHAGYYEVLLNRAEVDVRLTSSPRVGFHHYHFQKPIDVGFVLDLEHRDLFTSCSIQEKSSYRIEGHRHSTAWADNQKLFFVIEFSSPITQTTFFVDSVSGDTTKALFKFDNPKNVEIKVALSAVDIEGARKNLKAEASSTSFEQALIKNQQTWENALNRIQISDANHEKLKIFYTALYHTMIAPNLYSDVDGRYRGMDQNTYQDSSASQYTVFSLWDTYRATHPLFTIIEQQKTTEFIRSMLRKYQHGGILPIWDLSACYTGCMIGYHGVSVIADAYLKGITDFNVNLAFEAMLSSANQEHLGLSDYKSIGFIPMQNEAESVSKTLEYAYDDWCIAQVALKLGKDDEYHEFLKRSLTYRNLFDIESSFFRPRKNNLWLSPFDPYEVNSNYTEANAWHYGYSPVHDISGFINLHGGKEKLDHHLDLLFSASDQFTGKNQVDITGLIGQYAHGNEPSHHIAYLYNFINKPWKTQEKVHQILKTQYTALPDGISGNEDCGQMSAWYVLSAMGFYPVTPGSQSYIIGTPYLQESKIQLENGNNFIISTQNLSDKNKYIQSATLNGHDYPFSYILHNQIMKGGRLNFIMGPTPNTKWASHNKHVPVSSTSSSHFVPTPFITKGDISFNDSTLVELSQDQKFGEVFYSKNGDTFSVYKGEQLVLKEHCELCIYAHKNHISSPTICTNFKKLDHSRSVVSSTNHDPMYNGGHEKALIDGLMGGKDYRTGGWQGFYGKDFNIIIDLNNTTNIQRLQANFLQDENSWIFHPKKVNYYLSEDGESYEKIGSISAKHTPREKGNIIYDYLLDVDNLKARYIKIEAQSIIDCPSWHKGSLHQGKAWLFIDEIMINE